MKKTLKIISIIITSLLVVATLTILIFATISAKKKQPLKIFGISYAIVVTESMEPVIDVGDIVIIKGIDYENIKKDDIICFYNPKNKNMTITHRVVEITSDNKFVTKGDNNTQKDNWIVTKDEYIGKIVKHTSLLGIGKLVMNGKGIFFLALIAIFLYIIISESISISKLIKKKKKDQNKEKEREALIKEIKEEIALEQKEEKDFIDSGNKTN